MSVALREKLLQQVDVLPYDLQRRVLDFAQALAITQPKGVPGKKLVKFAGSISAEDARQMREAIESECEKVDDEW
jgi:hypothetical protein